MDVDIVREVRLMKQMTSRDLQRRYAEVFGEEARSNNKAFLFKRIAWRIQVLQEGDISELARRRAHEIACDADLRIRAPKDFEEMPITPPAPQRTLTADLDVKTDDRLPMEGAELVRHYKGREVIVNVLEDGFMFEGQRYRSLSAIANEVTGKHWNGFDFFGLRKKGGKREAE